MASIKVNIASAVERLSNNLAQLKDKEYLLRPMVTELLPIIVDRIHTEGKKSDGTQIGTYKPSYLRYRQEKYKRKPDTKIILSLTGQLENDWSVVATQRGYGIGLKNKANLIKLEGNEDRFGPIAKLTKDERAFAVARINQIVKQIADGL
jgi:hypothetical protein